MKCTFTLSGQNLQIFYLVLIGILWMPCIAFAIEPIGTIGQPYPVRHAFFSNEAILRAAWTHIQIVDLNTGAVIDEFGERSDSSEVIFSPTAAHLAILNYSFDSETTTVNIWNVNTREQISEWAVPTHGYHYTPHGIAAFSPTEPLFAASFDDKIRLWNWQTGALVGTMEGQRRPWGLGFPRDHTLVFSSDGHYLMVASTRPDVELWNVETRRLEGHFEGHTGNRGGDIVVSPDGRLIATFEAESNVVYLWNMETQHLLWKARSGIGNVAACTFSPDSQRLYVATRTGALNRLDDGTWEGWDDQGRVWDVKSRQQIQIWDGSALLPSQSVAVKPQDKQIVILGEVKRNQLLQNFPNPFNPETWIPFRLANESHVTIHIHSSTGQLVRRLSLGIMPAGDYSSQAQAVYWDGRNQVGEPVSSGVYLYTINTGDFSATRKMLIRK